MFDVTFALSLFKTVSSDHKNYHIMEPLRQPDATEGSAVDQEALVASVRTTLRDLQESVQDLCKANLHKILTIC